MEQQNDQVISEEALETPRLKLYRPTTEHTSALSDLWRDEQVRQYLGGAVSQEVIDGKIDWLQRHWEQAGFGLWTVCEKETGSITGLCGLHYSEDGIEISYYFFPAFWGRGLSTEAVRVSLDHGFRTLALERIIAITQKANLASCRMLEKVGMRHTDTFERFSATQHYYGITRDEWLESDI